MLEITVPFPISEIIVAPEPTGRLRLSDDIQQTLSSIMGYDGQSRRPLRCSNTGVLFISSASVKAITVVTATSAGFAWAGSNIATSEVLVRNRTGQAGVVYVAVDDTAGADNSFVLAAGESITIAINNLSRLHLLISTDTEKADLVYTR